MNLGQLWKRVNKGSEWNCCSQKVFKISEEEIVIRGTEKGKKQPTQLQGSLEIQIWLLAWN